MHVAAFIILVLTGIILFIPVAGFIAQNSWIHIIHLTAAVLFVVAPLVQLFINPGTSMVSIKRAFIWGKDDMEWVRALPRYYFLNDESAMPPQDEMNTGQKMWLLVLLVMVPVLVITGIVMWFFKYALPSGVFNWCVFFHDVAFIVTFVFLLIHVFLDVIHPLMRMHGGSFRSMVDGKVTVEYAKSHHENWYDRILKQ